MENTPETFSLVEDRGMKRGPGLGDMSGTTHSLEEDQEDSITASSADKRDEGLVMFWVCSPAWRVSHWQGFIRY